MATALTLLLMACLLQTARCGESVSMPQTINVLSGSCVTIPCSFDVRNEYTKHLDKTCKAMWKNEQGAVVFDSSNPQSPIKGNLTGDLTKRDCTTTLYNMKTEDRKKYSLRVECDNVFKHDFVKQKLQISVGDDPPTPTLTPSTLKVNDGNSVTLTCSAPAPCLSHPPTLTWTPVLGDIQETLQENQDKTKVKTSVLTFTASHLHHRQEISCTAVYNKQDGSTESSVSRLTADVSCPHCEESVFMPQTINVLSGSCVTIPCSFDVKDGFRSNLDKTCKAMWKTEPDAVVFNSSNPQSPIKGNLTGDLTKKDCTTTLYNMKPGDSKKYFLRVECNNPFKHNFIHQKLQISVRDDPPTPTLTPSTLKVNDGNSVTLTCSAPAPCPSHPPTLTWTPGLGDTRETLQENQDKTKFKTSVLTFTASHLHHGQEISCTAVYNKQDGSTKSSVSRLTADVSYPPKNTTVSVSPSGPVPENITVTLTCSSTANPAVRDYTWYSAQGVQETVMGTGHVLQIQASKVSVPFFCKAENDLGPGRSTIRQIDVQYAPKHTTVSVSPSGSVPENITVTLTCSSTANPAVRNYTWYTAQGGQETVMGTGHVIQIQASKDSVPFFCKAENDLGPGRSTIRQIDVQYAPKHTTVSVSPSGSVPENINVTLTCNSTANPAVRNYTWYTAQGGQETVMGTGHVIQIQASKDSVPFFCKAENDLGRGRSSIRQIDVQYPPKNITVSVSPTGPVPEDSTMTLTCSSTANPAVRNYTWYTAQGGQETVMGTGHVLHIQASKVSVPFFCKAENDLGAGQSTNREIDVQFAPQILPSSDCTQTADQLNCSCGAVGNPSPTLQWYLDGLPVNHSDKFAISSESVNDTGLRTIITVNQPQWRDLSTLFCRSSNSQGSVTQRFHVYSLEPQTSTESHDLMMLTVFIITVVALLVLVCALLLVIRAQKIHHNGLKSTVVMSQLETTTAGEGNEAPNTEAEESIYANTTEPNTTSLPNSGPNNEEEATKSSEKTNEEGANGIYSSVNWKTKSKKKRESTVDMDPPGGSYLEEERCMVGVTRKSVLSSALEVGSLYDNVGHRNVNKEVECEYAQVTFKNKSNRPK